MSNIKFLFLLLAFSISICISAQVKEYEYYGLRPCENSINQNVSADQATLNLSMLDNQYDLSLTTISHGIFGDNISVLLISYGTYSECEDHIILHDTIFGFEMDFGFDTNGELIASKCLSMMKGKTLVNNSVVSRTELYPKVDMENWQDDYIKPTDYPFDLIGGKYMARLSGRHELNLESDGRYEYIVDGFMISEGKWQQENNTLVLYDDFMDTPIRTLVVADNTISTYLPGNFRVLLFRYSFEEAERYESSCH